MKIYEKEKVRGWAKKDTHVDTLTHKFTSLLLLSAGSPNTKALESDFSFEPPSSIPPIWNFSRVCRDQKYWWTVVCCCRREWRQLIRKFTHPHTVTIRDICVRVCV